MMKKARLLILASVFVLVFGGAMSVMAQDRNAGPITTAIRERGSLICGVNKSVRGFGFQNPDTGDFEGFDIDFCRAVAVAILGDPKAVDFRPLNADQRQAAIQTGEIDLMVRNTTWTASRDVDWGAIFGPTNFYDGQGVMTRVDLGVNSIAELDGTTMCVQSGTTTELNITDYISSNSLDIELAVFQDADATWEAYIQGRCESWTTDKSGLAAYRISNAENPGDHIILPETISKEPLGPLSPQSDPQFAEIVAWTVFGLIQAEEFGIDSTNVDEFLMKEGEAPEAYSARVSPAIQRLLGQNGNVGGGYFTLKADFMVDVIKAVGNYGEIYERNLTPLGLTRAGSLNDLWTRGGILYSPPFR